MKSLLLCGVLVASGAARAQTVTITTSMAALYRPGSDTTTAPFYLTKGNEVTLLSADHPLWAQVARGGKTYFTRRQNVGLSPIPYALIPLTVLAAIPREPGTGKVHYTAVGTVDGLARDALYLRAKTWAINAFYSPKDVISTEEQDVGIIICKGFSEETIRFQGARSRQRLYFTVQVSVKEGRYKYDFSDFSFQPADNEMGHVPVEPYVAAAYNAAGRPNYEAMEFARALLAKAARLEATVKTAMQRGDEW